MEYQAGPYENNVVSIHAHTLSGAPIATASIDKIADAVLDVAKDEQMVMSIYVDSKLYIDK